MTSPASMTSDEIHAELCRLYDNNTDDARMQALQVEKFKRPRIVGIKALLAAKAAR